MKDIKPRDKSRNLDVFHQILTLFRALPRSDDSHEKSNQGVSLADLSENSEVIQCFHVDPSKDKSPEARKRAIARMIEQIASHYQLQKRTTTSDWLDYDDFTDLEINPGTKHFYRIGPNSKRPHLPLESSELDEVIAVYDYLSETGAINSIALFRTIGEDAKNQRENASEQMKLPTVLMSSSGPNRISYSDDDERTRVYDVVRKKLVSAIKNNYSCKIKPLDFSTGKPEINPKTNEVRSYDIVPLAIGVKGYFQYVIYTYKDKYDKWIRDTFGLRNTESGKHSDHPALKLMTKDLSKICFVSDFGEKLKYIQEFKLLVAKQNELEKALSFHKELKTLENKEDNNDIVLKAFSPLIGHFLSHPFKGSQIKNPDTFSKDGFLELHINPQQNSLDLKNFVLGHLQFIEVVGSESFKRSLIDDLQKAKLNNVELFSQLS